jgi:FtsZ-binding cell division protein ZapB
MLKYDNNEFIMEPYKINDSNLRIRKFRSDSSPYLWIRPEDVPFEISPKEKIQLNIFNELTNNVLLIRFKSELDSLNDLLFIYFNQNLNSFGTVSISKILSPDNKTIIAMIVRNALMAYLSNMKQDKELFSTLTENIQSLIDTNRSLQLELNEIQDKSKESLIQLAQGYLEEISRKYNVRYRLSESGLDKIERYPGELSSLRTILEKACQYAESLNLDDVVKEILILDYHIILPEKHSKKPLVKVPESGGDVPARYLRTLYLLDKLETAAQKVKSKNKLLTSINIGNEFPSPVTPPAITDALKKHRQKILYLFKEYPYRWEIIRNEFRPVQNIINASPEINQLSA